MRKSIFVVQVFVFIAAMFFTLETHSQPKINKDSVLSRLSYLKEKTKVKALIGGVWQGGQEIVSIALGESMTGVPAKTDMHVRIGGVSETFLGTLLMILAEKGVISLNDKVSKWFPGLLAADKVTVAMLMKNTSGYKDYVLEKDFQDLILKDPFRTVSREEIINYSVRDGKLNFEPGTEQKYSHTEYTILAQILEKATGKKMSELHEEYLFRPLGLEHTGFFVNAELPSPVLHSFTSDRGIYEDASFWNPTWTGDSGPLYSNLPDLGKWAPIFGKGKLLSPAYYDSLFSPPPVMKGKDRYIASGFVVLNGWFFQNPSFNGYSGGFAYFPSGDITVIIYTTESQDPDSDSQAIKIVKEIIDIITPDNPLN